MSECRGIADKYYVRAINQPTDSIPPKPTSRTSTLSAHSINRRREPNLAPEQMRFVRHFLYEPIGNIVLRYRRRVPKHKMPQPANTKGPMLCVHAGRRCVRSLSRFRVARPRRGLHRRPGPTCASPVGQLGQSALSLSLLCSLRSEVVAYTKDGDKADQEAGETHGLKKCR